MVAIVFAFEDWTQHVGLSEPHSTLARWRQNMKAANVSHLGMVDLTAFKIGQYYDHKDADIGFSYFDSLAEAETAFPEAAGRAWVYLEGAAYLDSQGVPHTSLLNFAHPTVSTVIYVVGPDTVNIPTAGREDKTWVSIPAKAEYSFYAEQAAMLALYDRYSKG